MSSHSDFICISCTRDLFATDVLQLEVEGNLPNFITTPIMIDTVKKAMFKQAKSQYSNEKYMTHWINSARKNQTNDEMIKERLGLLMTP